MIKRNRTAQTPARSRWKTYLLIMTCGPLTVSGFFFAGRQHFSWMDIGMKNSRLRKQIDDLQAEKRRLLLAREISLSPTEIKKAAKKVGISESPEGTTTVAQVMNSTKEKAVPPASGTVSVASTSSTAKPMIIKTAAVRAVPAATAATFKKADRPRLIAKNTAAE